MHLLACHIRLTKYHKRTVIFFIARILPFGYQNSACISANQIHNIGSTMKIMGCCDVWNSQTGRTVVKTSELNKSFRTDSDSVGTEMPEHVRLISNKVPDTNENADIKNKNLDLCFAILKSSVWCSATWSEDMGNTCQTGGILTAFKCINGFDPEERSAWLFALGAARHVLGSIATGWCKG